MTSNRVSMRLLKYESLYENDPNIEYSLTTIWSSAGILTSQLCPPPEFTNPTNSFGLLAAEGG